VPNVARVLANSPAALDGFLGLYAGLSGSAIGEKLQTQILLSVSQTQRCDYCTSLLTSAFAPKAGLTADEVLGSRRGTSDDAKAKAALAFAGAVLESRGRVSDAQLASARAAGFGDAHLVEIVAAVALGCLTNFLNNVADTDLDVPQAAPLAA
jgi:alkylhydroperoxidase family enzyme